MWSLSHEITHVCNCTELHTHMYIKLVKYKQALGLYQAISVYINSRLIIKSCISCIISCTKITENCGLGMVGSGSQREIHHFLADGIPHVVMTHFNKWVVTHLLNKYLTLPIGTLGYEPKQSTDVFRPKAQCYSQSTLPFLEGGSCLMLFKYMTLSFNQ